MMPMLFVLINASIKGTLTKSRVTVPLRYHDNCKMFQCPLIAIVANDANWNSKWLECSELKSTVLAILNEKTAW